MTIVWAPLALERVADIAGLIAQDRPHAAQTWVQELFSAVDRLNHFPQSGRVVPEVRREDVREIIFGDFRILYRVEPEQVSILTVRHARQRTTEAHLSEPQREV